jgi:lactate permease
MGYGIVYALWPIMWIVFAALWLYNLGVETGKFDLLRCWMEHHASGDMRVQAIMVAFCFGALLEGTAGFGAPVAMTAFLLVALGFKASRAVTVSLIANTTPVAFGALGTPIVALAAVTALIKRNCPRWLAGSCRSCPYCFRRILSFSCLAARD